MPFERGPGGGRTAARHRSGCRAKSATPDARRNPARTPTAPPSSPSPRNSSDKQRAQRPLAHAETAHRGAAIEMPAHVAMRGHRDRNRREHRGQQRHEREKMTRAIERLAHLRLTVLQRFERDAAHLAAVDACRARTPRTARPAQSAPATSSRYVTRLPNVIRPVRREFVGAHHQARREIDEGEAAIELARDDRRHREGATCRPSPYRRHASSARRAAPDRPRRCRARESPCAGLIGRARRSRDPHARRAADNPATPP